MSNLTRRLRLDLASLLSAALDPLAPALAELEKPGDGPRVQMTGLDLVLPLRFEPVGGASLRVRLPSRTAPQLGHPGSLAVHVAPAGTEERG